MWNIPDLSHSKKMRQNRIIDKATKKKRRQKKNTMDKKLVLLRNRLNGFLWLPVCLLACLLILFSWFYSFVYYASACGDWPRVMKQCRRFALNTRITLFLLCTRCVQQWINLMVWVCRNNVSLFIKCSFVGIYDLATPQAHLFKFLYKI